MLKLGHRGASAAAPENTLGAFRMALAMGADGVELDVHRCKSGELVVIHDETVDRTTDGSGRVAGMTLGDVQALRVAKEEYIPTLEEVFAALAGAYCFVEVKQADAALPAAALICREVANGWPAGRLWLISFRHESLAAALAAYPDLLIGMSYEKLDASSIAHAHASGARAVIPHHASITSAHVKEAHRLGLKVIGWTANDPSDIARLKALEVDGIISDFPGRLSASRA